MSDRSISGLLLATSAGAPMRSARPKPIHLLCGRAMASYVLDSLGDAGVRQAVVVTGVNGGRVSKRLLEDPPRFPVRFVEQKGGLGAGDAALIGINNFDDFDDDEDLLIVPADVPLLRASTLERLVDTHRSSGAACTVLTTHRDPAGDPAGEVVVRDRHDRFVALEGERPDDPQGDILLGRRRRVEPPSDEDAEGGDRPVEVSLGVYCVRRGLLAPALRRTGDTIDGRVVLADLVEVLTGSGHAAETALTDHPEDLRPVDDRLQLAEAEAELRRRTNRHWLSMGVTMVDPDRTYIDATVKLGTDITIFPGTILQGATTVGDGCEIGPDTRLDRCDIGNHTRIEKSTASLATVGDDCQVGPFAALEPGVDVPDGTVTGPFYAGRGGA